MIHSLESHALAGLAEVRLRCLVLVLFGCKCPCRHNINNQHTNINNRPHLWNSPLQSSACQRCRASQSPGFSGHPNKVLRHSTQTIYNNGPLKGLHQDFGTLSIASLPKHPIGATHQATKSTTPPPKAPSHLRTPSEQKVQQSVYTRLLLASQKKLNYIMCL